MHLSIYAVYAKLANWWAVWSYCKMAGYDESDNAIGQNHSELKLASHFSGIHSITILQLFVKSSMWWKAIELGN